MHLSINTLAEGLEPPLNPDSESGNSTNSFTPDSASWDSNPDNSHFECDTYTNSITDPNKVDQEGFEPSILTAFDLKSNVHSSSTTGR